MQGVQVGPLARGSGRAGYGLALGCRANYVIRRSGETPTTPSWEPEESSVARPAERWPSRPCGPGASHVAVSRPD